MVSYICYLCIERDDILEHRNNIGTRKIER